MSKLSRVNSVLLALIVLINGYIIILPFVPAIIFDWQSHHGKQQQLETEIHHLQTQGASSGSKAASTQVNQLIVPSMLLDSPILEGPVSKQYQILNQGIWRWPDGSTPDKGGNTVLIGHRFTYTNPRGIFYFLNKVAVGDSIGVWWNNKEYVYQVASVQQVPPTDTAIEDQTTKPELTVFTCTPLLLPKDRLVVVADLEANQ